MHRLCQRAFRLLDSRPTARYHICLPCASRLSHRPFATSITRHAEEGEDDSFVVRYFEQTADGNVRRVSEDEQENEAKVLKTRIRQLEKKLREIEDSGRLSQVLGEDAGILQRHLVNLRTRRKEDEDLLDEVKLDGVQEEDLTASSELDVGVSQHQRVHLQSFNKVLREVAKSVEDVKKNAILWTKYVTCKQRVPDFLEEISSAAWEVLWRSQYVGNPVVESRTRHLWELVDDMDRVRQKLSPTQKLVRIEALFSRGDREQAMALWQSGWNPLGPNDEKRADFRDLGIRLYVELDKLKEAQDLALKSAETDSKPKAENISILVSTWAEKGDDASLKVAWSLYLDLRQRLGSRITLDDYDHIVMSFLKARSSSLALAVFKDMVLSGKRPDWDSTELVKRSSATYRELQNHSTGLADLTQISLASLAFIPRQLENKYFYASWIKRLIGMGEVDSAVPVLALMYERGIRPDAIHLNGMISAWLREEDKQKHNLALQVGWSMVKERLKFVARRNASDTENQFGVDIPDLGVLVPPYISKNLPPATIETFSILLLYYENRSMHTSMQIVQQMLRRAQLSPNSFFMNHLLHAELRRGQVAQVWKRFEAMRNTVSPDMATFSVLWESSKVFTAGRNLSAKEGFPSPRALFFTMAEWLSNQKLKVGKPTEQGLSQPQYNQIIRCFCFRRDIEGTIVALYALREFFKLYPDADTVRLVTIQIARMGETVPTAKRRRSRLSANKESVRNMMKVSEIFEVVSKERTSVLQSLGLDEEALSVQQRGEELLFKLAEVLRIFMRHSTGIEVDKSSPQEESFDKVAWEMGVGGINLESPPLYQESVSVH